MSANGLNFKFDLRPLQFREAAKTASAIDISRILFVLFLILFVASATGSLTLQWLRLRTLSMEQEALSGSVATLQAQDNKLSEELNRLKAEETRYATALALVRDDLPSLEFLAALEGSLPGTVWIESVGIGGGSATVVGSAYAESDVVVFSNALAQATVIKDVLVPTVSKAGDSAYRKVRFTMQCALRDIASANAPRPSPAP